MWHAMRPDIGLIIQKEISDCAVEPCLMVALLIRLPCFCGLFFLSGASRMPIHLVISKLVYNVATH